MDRKSIASLSEQAHRILDLVRTGKVYDLSVELGRPASRSSDRQEGLVSVSASFLADPSGSGKAFRSERIAGPLHHGTHVDMLDHFSVGSAPFDGLDGKHAGYAGPMVCRGVLVDIAAYLGHTVADGFVIEPELMTATIQAQGIRVQEGDAVLIRTGKADSFAEDPEAAWFSCPGVSRECAKMLSESGMKIFGIDAASPDPLPIIDWSNTAHEELLVKRKTHIVENLYLKKLAEDGISEFLFVCAPLRIHNATGAWARPIAIA